MLLIQHRHKAQQEPSPVLSGNRQLCRASGKVLIHQLAFCSKHQDLDRKAGQLCEKLWIFLVYLPHPDIKIRAAAALFKLSAKLFKQFFRRHLLLFSLSRAGHHLL